MIVSLAASKETSMDAAVADKIGGIFTFKEQKVFVGGQFGV